MINRAVTSKDFSLYADYLVSKIVPKEKLKIKYRGYGCLTPLPRHKNLIQEKNTKEFMEEYCDEQGSTLSELSLIKKLYALRNLKEAYQGYTCLCINFDASGWNKRFRSQTVNPIMENSLDRIFNYPIFTTTHEMYKKMLFYTSDDIYTMWWEGHEGGVEGQNTDTRLYCYIQQIKSSLDKYSLPYHLLGRGDDMRIFVLIPPQYLETRTMEEIRSDLMENLSTDMVGFNQHIKVDDCYASEVYFAFGKVSSLYMVELPTAFRKISQCYGANNAFMPLLRRLHRVTS